MLDSKESVNSIFEAGVVDCHAHIDPKPQGDQGFELGNILRRCDQNGVEAVVYSLFIEDRKPEVDLAELARLARERRVRVRVALGSPPPCDLPEIDRWLSRQEEELGAVADLAREPSVVAVGEVGLDYHWLLVHFVEMHGPKGKKPPAEVIEDRYRELKEQSLVRKALELQKKVFRGWIDLAVKLDMPLVVHIRDVKGYETIFADALAVLQDSKIAPEQVMFHCFAGSPDSARTAVQRGYFVSVPSSAVARENFRKVAAVVELRRLLIETDSPYHAPVEGLWQNLCKQLRAEGKQLGLDRENFEKWVEAGHFMPLLRQKFAHLTFPDPREREAVSAADYFRSARHRIHNEPTFVRCAAEAVAEIQGRRVDDVCRATTANATEFYRLDRKL